MVSDIIAAMALVVSILGLVISLWRTRKALRIRVDKNAWSLIGNVFATDEEGEKRQNPFNISETHVISITLINPSAEPISYFDLTLVDHETKMPLAFPVRPWLESNRVSNPSYQLPGMICSVRLMLPDDSFGCVMPNEYKKIMLAFHGLGHSAVDVSLKTTQWRLFKRKGTDHYRTVCEKIELTDQHTAPRTQTRSPQQEK